MALVTASAVTARDYPDLVRLFLELRNHGMSVSSTDLDIIKAWEEENIHPEFIGQMMLEHAEECKKKSKKFPASLLPLARIIRAIIIKRNEY